MADMREFHVGSSQIIQWNLIRLLADIQGEIGLKFGNKLGHRHVEWYKAKMKVKLAAQTFSASVADPLATLRVLDSRFTDADLTIEFIRQAS